MGYVELLVIGVLISVAVGALIAHHRHRNPWEGAGLGCLFGPFGWLIEVLNPVGGVDEYADLRVSEADRQPSTPQPTPTQSGSMSGVGDPQLKRCPDCAELVLAGARICRFCRYEFWPDRSQ